MRFHTPRWRHFILRLQRIGDDLRADAQRSQLRLLDLDVDLLRLHAEQLDLLHALDIEDHAADFLGPLTHFLIAVTIACNGINRAVNIVEAIVVEGPHCTIRQVLFDIFAEVTHIAPGRTNLRLRQILPQIDVDDRLSRPRLARHVIEARRILDFLLQLVRDLLLDLRRRRARPGH